MMMNWRENVTVIEDPNLRGDALAEYFNGCEFVGDTLRVRIPGGRVLSKGCFNATFGGWVFHVAHYPPTTKAHKALVMLRLWPRLPNAE